MPRLRAARREPCDCLDCREGPLLAAGSAAVPASSAARLDPPPRSLVVVIDHAVYPGGTNSNSRSSVAEALSTSLDAVDRRHLDSLASEGCTGRLALRPGAASLAQQLLGLAASEAPDGSSSSSSGGGCTTVESLADRFMGLQAALWTDSSEAAAAGGALCCGPVLQLGAWPEPRAAAKQICSLLEVVPGRQSALPSLLGVQAAAAGQGDAAVSEDTPDMLFLLLDSMSGGAPGGTGSSMEAESAAAEAADNSSSAEALQRACGALQWLDGLVMELNQVPGFRQSVLLTVVLGCAALPLLASQRRPLVVPEGDAAGFAPVRRPRQSYEVTGAGLQRSAVVVHRLTSVIRRDRVSELDLQQIAERGGGGCIWAGHLLPEVAYKLGRAPKYGA